MVYNFINESTLPYDFYYGSAVVYNNKIHILGGYSFPRNHYSWDGTEWTEESTLPYNFYYGSAVVYNNKIHILGSNSGHIKHYSWDGTEWTEESTLPYDFYSGAAVVYNNKIHILGSNHTTATRRKHYSWDGTEWTEESTLPYDFYSSAAVVYNNKIHILGGYATATRRNHYSWDGSEWIEESTLPYDFYYASAVVYNNKIYILGDSTGNDEYSYYDGYNWSDKYFISKYGPFRGNSSVIYNNKIHILGGSNLTHHVISEVPKNTVKYGDKTIIDISDCDIINEDVKSGSYAYDRSGKLIKGLRPPYYEYASEYISASSISSIQLMSGTEIYAFSLGGTPIYLRNPTANPGYAQLVSYKPDTESVINILTGIPTTLIDYFRIVDIRYVDKWTVVITYTYRTANSHAADSDYAYYNRSIHIKKDGSLYQYSQVQVSGAWAANYGCIEDTLIVPMLYPQKTSFEGFIIYRNYYNITTGTLYLRQIPYYTAMRNSAAGDQPYIYINGNIATVLVNQSANGRVCWPTENIKIRGGMFFTNTSGVASLFLITKYQTDSSYPFNGAITTFCSDSENINKLKLNIPNKYTGKLTDDNDFLRKLLVMGLLNDNSTLVVLRKELDYEPYGEGDFQYRFLGCWLDFWECNVSTKTLVYRLSLELSEEEQTSIVTSNIYDDWYDSNDGTISLAYLDDNIFYYRVGNSSANNIKVIQINPLDCSVKNLQYAKGQGLNRDDRIPGARLLGSHSDPMNNVFIYD